MAAQGHTVLVVDDDQALRLLCRVNLELEGYRVIEADGVGAAETLWLEESPDAILLDVHLRDGDGLELLERMRAKQPGPPVALFTGSVELDASTRSVAEGVLGKPFTLDELSGTVARLVGL
jgi:two-component system nitrogen regulation response regulator GlnG